MTVFIKRITTFGSVIQVNTDFSMDTQLEKIDLATKIGQNIKKCRADKKLNQSQLAKLCGMDRQHMEKIENAKVSANIYTLYVIASALEIKVSQLLDL